MFGALLWLGMLLRFCAGLQAPVAVAQPKAPRIILAVFPEGGTAAEWAGARAAVRDLTGGGGLAGMSGVVLRAAAPSPGKSIAQLLGGALSVHAVWGNRIVGIAAPPHTSTTQERGELPWQVLLFPQQGSPPRPLPLPTHLPTHLRSPLGGGAPPSPFIADDALAARRLALTLTGGNCSCATTNVGCTATPLSQTWAVVVLVILLVLLALAVVGLVAARRAGIILIRRGGGRGHGSNKVGPIKMNQEMKNLWQIDLNEVRQIKMVGKGQYGTVHRSEWRGKAVALKLLKNDQKSVTSEAMEEFESEVNIMLNMRHPNVLMFLGASTTKPHLAIITEYMDQGSLFGVFHPGSGAKAPDYFRTWNNRIKIATDVALGMNYLHSSSPMIVHRDLKTPNCLVNSVWEVRVADFGLTKLKSEITNLDAVGNPLWAAPEVFASEHISEKVDVYSFGIVLWEIITLEAPFQNQPLMGLPVSLAGGLRPTVPDNIPDAVKKIMARCWAHNPEDRPDFEEVLEQVRAARVDEVSVSMGIQKEVDHLPQCYEGKSISESKTAGESEERTGSFFKTNDFTVDFDGNVMKSSTVKKKKTTAELAEWDLNPKTDLKYGRRLGEGMCGEVFLGTFKGAEVAIKKIYFSSLEDDTIMDFHNESRLMKKMTHPNIVMMKACAVKAPYAYIVLEFCQRGSLYDMYLKGRKTKPSWLQCTKMMLESAMGVNYLHSQNVVHRDLKSPNLMVATDYTTKVGDFGLSRVQDTTKTMTMCGSPLWTAPEMLCSVKYDEKVDVYSLAIMLWEFFAWEEPYPNMAVFQVSKGVRDGTLRPTIKKDKMSQTYIDLMQDMWHQVRLQHVCGVRAGGRRRWVVLVLTFGEGSKRGDGFRGISPRSL